MSDPPDSYLSDTERKVLRVLWDHGPLKVRDIIALVAKQGHEWTRSTVVSFLRRLEAKRYIKIDKRQFAFVYKPIVSREDEMYSQVTKLAGNLSDGNAVSLIIAFASRHPFSSEELVRLRRLINGL